MEARVNAGVIDVPLFVLTIAYNGASFSVKYNNADRSQFNHSRQRNTGTGEWDNTLYDIPSETSPGDWEFGAATSATETLYQCLTSAVADIISKGYDPELLFVCFIHGQADALRQDAADEYGANESLLKDRVEETVGAAGITWLTVLLSGDSLNRTGAGTINAAKTALASQSNVYTIDPTEFTEYDEGGIHGVDGVHLSDLGCWRISDRCFSLSIDSGNFGVPL